MTPMLCAVSEGKLDTVIALKEVEADVSAKNKEGWTAIHSAALSEHMDIVEALIEVACANFSTKDK